jgi:ApaG protein
MFKTAQCFAESQVTQNVEVVAIGIYLPQQSSPANQQYIYAYKIKIINHGNHTIQLLRRKWIITDGLGGIREVEGEGVIGQQPVLAPGQSHEYVSGTDMPTPIGSMKGYYLMRYIHTGETFQVNIPAFTLCTPEYLN